MYQCLLSVNIKAGSPTSLLVYLNQIGTQCPPDSPLVCSHRPPAALPLHLSIPFSPGKSLPPQVSICLPENL